MRPSKLLKFSRLFVMSTLLMTALIFCQFLGLKHSIVHGFSSTHSNVLNLAPSSNYYSSDWFNQQPSSADHHCSAWDHATLSIGAISASAPALWDLGTFELKLQHPHPFVLPFVLFSYLSRAPPVLV
jgi:hypothetical protein